MRALIDRSIIGPSAKAESALEPLRSIRLQFDPLLSRRSESDRPQHPTRGRLGDAQSKPGLAKRPYLAQISQEAIMVNRSRVVVAALWILSLFAAGRLARAESDQVRPDPLTLEQYVVYSGNDIGFRVYKPLEQVPTGRLVVKMNGRWTEVEIKASGSK